MSIPMPEPDQEVIARRADIIKVMQGLVPAGNVLVDDDELRAYESDALPAYHALPLIVVLPETTAQVSQILKYCHKNDVKIVPRGSGTGLTGATLPLADAITLAMGKFNKILEIDYDNRCVVAQSGCTNLSITDAVADEGFYYAPDPSSQIACSIGGNIGTNAGGVHCLKYGLTTNNVMGLEIVLIDGEVIRIGGKHMDSEGYDLLGLLTGAEGLLGVITDITVRILQKPETARARSHRLWFQRSRR